MEENEYFKLGISRVFDKLLCTSQEDDEVTLNDITRCQNILLKEIEKEEDIIRKNVCKKLNVDFCYSSIKWGNNIFSFSVKKHLDLSFNYDVDMELIKNENSELSIFNSTYSEYASYILDNAKEELNEYYNFMEEKNLMCELKDYNINIDSNNKIIIRLNCSHIYLNIFFNNKRMVCGYKYYDYNKFKFNSIKYPECSYENINSLINNNLFIKIKDLPPYMQEKLYSIRKEQINHIEEKKEKINKLILKSKRQNHI